MLTTKKTSNYNFCSECEGDLVSIIERGEVVCQQCGLVISEREIDFLLPYD